MNYIPGPLAYTTMHDIPVLGEEHWDRGELLTGAYKVEQAGNKCFWMKQGKENLENIFRLSEWLTCENKLLDGLLRQSERSQRLGRKHKDYTQKNKLPATHRKPLWFWFLKVFLSFYYKMSLMIIRKENALLCIRVKQYLDIFYCQMSFIITRKKSVLLCTSGKQSLDISYYKMSLVIARKENILLCTRGKQSLYISLIFFSFLGKKEWKSWVGANWVRAY